MPLDGTDLFDNQPLAKLERVQRLLATEQQWCKGRLRDADGRHCLVGAIAAVGGRQELTRPIMRAAREVGGKHYWRIESFNDDPRTAHRDVLRVLQRTRENIITELMSAREPRSWRRKWVQALRTLAPSDERAMGAGLCPIGIQDQPAGGGPDPFGYGRPARLRSSAIRETSDASW